MKSKKYYFWVILIIFILLYFRKGVSFVPAEELSILSAIGMDVIKGEDGKTEYNVPVSIYNFGTQPSTKSIVLTGKGKTIGQTREERQLKMDKKLLLGLEKLVVANDELARLGIMPWTDILFANPNVNDTGFFVVSKDKAEDLFNIRIEGYPNIGDYIEGMIKHSVEQNFFAKKYELFDLYKYTTNEGNNLVSPYIEIKNDFPSITGMAIFKGDKMIRKIDMEETRGLNLLRESNVRGTISIEESIEEYTDVYITSKKKVKVEKEGEKYKFNINLDIDGYVLSNLLYESPFMAPESIKKMESEVKKEVERMTREFVEKMQNDYEVDCLNLGRYAAAKYGRHKDIDWNEVVKDADINVNAKVKISLKTRGQIK